MKTDTLNRRIRFAPPNPKVKRLELQDGDFLLFEAIDRFGPLPSHYLYELSKHIRRDRTHLQNRLTEFYNGDSGGPYLTRPPAQFNSFEARYQPITYDLSARTRALLNERRTLGYFPLKRTNEFVHDLMGACVAVSIKLACEERGLRYISREELLSRKGNPLPIAVPDGILIPDDLFGIEGKDEKGAWFRYFAVEIDRNSESIETRAGLPAKFGRKVVSYDHILRSRSHAEWWGVSNLTVLTVTTNGRHAENIAKFVKKTVDARALEKFVFFTEPCFGSRTSEEADGFWRMPKGLLPILAAPLMTAKGYKDITQP